MFQGTPLEANSVFPAATLTGTANNPATTYKSSYFEPGYFFPWNPDSLSRNNVYRIYDEMKDDDQVKAAVSFKKDIVVNSGWRIVCDNEDVKDFVEDSLSEDMEIDELGKSFDDVLRDMLSSYEYGFSLSEPVYALNDDNLYYYKSIKVRPPHSFRFDLDDYGKVTKITQSTARNGEVQLDPKIFLHHVYQPEFGNPYGKSDLKAAHPAWVAKKFFMRMYAIYVERYASPTAVGKYKSTSGPDEIQRFFNMLKTLQTKTSMVIPEDLNIEFLQNQRDASDVYIGGMEMYNLWIARAILVPDLIGISGSKTEGGSYALGERQFKLFLTTIEKDRKSLERKITLKLIRPLVLANFGDVDAAFEFLPIAEQDELEYSKLWAEFMKSRLVKPTEEEVNHFRRSVKFPEGAVEITQPAPAPGQDPNNPGDPNNPNNPNNQKNPKDPNQPENKGDLGDPGEQPQKTPEDKTKKEKVDDVKMSHLSFREANQYEKVINFTAIKETLEKSENRIIPKLESAGRLIYKDFLDQVKSTGLIRNFQPDKINKLQPRFLKDMNVVFKNYFVDLFMAAYDEAQREIFPNKTKKFSDAELLPEEFLEIIQAESFKNVGDYSIEVTKRGKNVLVDGIKTGLSESKIIQLMDEEMKETSERWLKTVIRTKTTEIYNTARKTYWETDEIAKEIVEAYEFSAIIDDRTSDVCAELDGKVFEKGAFIDRVTPPLHMNCRSLLVPITKFQDYETDNEPSIEKLQKMGGNLILSDSSKTKIIIVPEAPERVDDKKEIRVHVHVPKVKMMKKEIVRNEKGEVVGTNEFPQYEEEK